VAQQRAQAAGGRLWLRNDDLDPGRSRPEFVAALREDLRWLGLQWDEPMVTQSERIPLYRTAFVQLQAAGLLYPCACSHREIESAANAPHEGAGHREPIYPGTCRPENRPTGRPIPSTGAPLAWRFHVPDGLDVVFDDGALGPRQATAGRDFGDFIVWRKDDLPSYQLACAVDDTDPTLGVTEVVRGADLVESTFRQALIARALGRPLPRYYHCALLADDQGRRLAKRHAALSLRVLRAQGAAPADIIARFGSTPTLPVA